ncbi:pantetheine-phosphate adenylyltransferase [Oxalobacteraceae bacterium CAVE-383]|nr:pantetheine-phosphate adenylyltransferase [Oxalobacteraceae bacterium CAVE-383]
MKKIAFSGTLDPITNGHMWVIEEARSLADEVTVFLSENPAKRPQFPAEKRKQIIELSAAERGWDNVRVVIVKGDYTARAAKKHGIDYLIRGIRNTADFDYENLIQQTNVDVLHGAKTIFVMPPRDLGSVSSSFVGALQGPVGWNWNVRKFMPGPAHRAWIVDWLRKEWELLWGYAGATSEAVQHADGWFERLTGPAGYGGPQRHYHNLDHLVHGLTEIRVWGLNTGAAPEAIALLKKAFWFHDLVHRGVGTAGMSDEEQSARLWLDSSLDPAAADDVAALIRVTDQLQAAAIEHPLKAAMASIDLAILGQDEEVYDAYAQAIRNEYRQTPDQTYRTRRIEVLTCLHGKAEAGSLYADAYFMSQYRLSAMANMRREIARLKADAA